MYGKKYVLKLIQKASKGAKNNIFLKLFSYHGKYNEIIL